MRLSTSNDSSEHYVYWKIVTVCMYFFFINGLLLKDFYMGLRKYTTQNEVLYLQTARDVPKILFLKRNFVYISFFINFLRFFFNAWSMCRSQNNTHITRAIQNVFVLTHRTYSKRFLWPKIQIYNTIIKLLLGFMNETENFHINEAFRAKNSIEK